MRTVKHKSCRHFHKQENIPVLSSNPDMNMKIEFDSTFCMYRNIGIPYQHKDLQWKQNKY